MTTITPPRSAHSDRPGDWQRSITRDVAFTMSRAAGDTGAPDGLTLEGHAAVFGQETEIDSWEGAFLESIRKGAFVKSLRERTPVLQFDHGRHPLIGSIPIGSFQALAEDDHGLFVQARLLDTWLTEPLRGAIANESINGMSFRFEVIRDAWTDNKGKALSRVEVDKLLWDAGDRGPLHRELVELRCPELGPVVFPAYPGTDVSVRAHEVAEAIMGDVENRRRARVSLTTGGWRPVATEVEAADVARALLWPDPDATSRWLDPVESGEPSWGQQLDRVRTRYADRALTSTDQATMATMMAGLASAGTAIGPVCDALCEADMALDAAARMCADMLGVTLPPEGMGPDGTGPATGAASTEPPAPLAAPLDEHPATIRTEPAAPLHEHPATMIRTEPAAPPHEHPATDAPLDEHPSPLSESARRRQFMRRAYLSREGIESGL